MGIQGTPADSQKSVTIIMNAGDRPTAEPTPAQQAYTPRSDEASTELNSLFKSMQNNHKITVSIGYLASGDMAKIYAASSTGAVRGVIFNVNANMKRMQHSGASEDQIDEVVRKMKRVLGKAQSKLGALKREAALENRRRIAELLQKREASRQLSDRLRKKRYTRRAREYCEIVDAGDILHPPGAQVSLPGTASSVGTVLPPGAIAAAPAAAGAAAGGIPASDAAGASVASASALNVVV